MSQTTQHPHRKYSGTYNPARANVTLGPRPGRYAPKGFFEGRMVREVPQKPPTDGDPVRQHYKWATAGKARSTEPAAHPKDGPPFTGEA